MKSDSAIRRKFAALKKNNEAALIIYLTAGYPSMQKFLDNVSMIAENGADIIEIGIPFSDPIADGPTIQFSSQSALENGFKLDDLISRIKERNLQIPLVLMSYLNPLLAYGRERLFKDIKKAGFSGVVIPDLPVEDAGPWSAAGSGFGIDNIFLAAPTSSKERIERVIRASRGFIYCVSVTGTTGMREYIPAGLNAWLLQIKKQTDKPIAVGFGISNRAQIRSLSDCCDGVIVGSRVIKAIKEQEDLAALIRSFKSATRRC